MAPPGTPASLAETLNKAFAAALAVPEVREHFAKMGVQAVGGSIAETARFIAAERALWGEVIRATDIKIE
jgi:tripartite-type tricarboxylate transporter receptor subunit TctC